MRSILGVVGGLGPEGTVHYYRKLASHFSATLPVEARPSILIDHVWMEEFVGLLRAEAETEIRRFLAASLERLHRAGAELALIASVTPHHFLGPLKETSPVQLVNLVEATQAELIAAGHRSVGLLGTRLTLTRPFFKRGLEQAGIRVVVPDERGIAYLDALIFGPVGAGLKTPEMKAGVGELIRRMTAEAKVDALVIACTDLMDLIEPTTALVDPIDCHIRLAARMLASRPRALGPHAA